MSSRGAKILAMLAKDKVQQKKSLEYSQQPVKYGNSSNLDTGSQIKDNHNMKVSDCGSSNVQVKVPERKHEEVSLDVTYHEATCQTENEYFNNIYEGDNNDWSDCDDSVVDKNYKPNISDISDSLSSSTEMEVQDIGQGEPSAEGNEIKQVGPSTKARWRKAKPETWKKQKNRKLRDECLPYENYKGIKQAPKHPKQIDCTKCKFRCTEKFSEDERKIICQKYWILSSYERKKDFILYNVSSSVPRTRRPRKENGKKRQNAKQYYFIKDSEKLQICHNFFMKTLCISNRVILSAFKDKDELGHFKGIDKRGRKTPGNKT